MEGEKKTVLAHDEADTTTLAQMDDASEDIMTLDASDLDSDTEYILETPYNPSHEPPPSSTSTEETTTNTTTNRKVTPLWLIFRQTLRLQEGESYEEHRINRPECRHPMLDPPALFQRFLALPRELRNLIYHHMFAHLPQEIIYRNFPLPKIYPAFCYTNHQIFEESIPILFIGRKLVLGEDLLPIIVEYMERALPLDAFKTIKRLCIEQRKPSGLCECNDFFASCTGLQDLEIKFDASIFHRFESDLGSLPRQRSPILSELDRIAKRFVSSVSNLPNLKTITLYCEDTKVIYTYNAYSVQQLSTFRHFLDRLKCKMERQQPKLHLKVIHVP